ncbi:MAG: RsmE family RNA methyltransferase, partial [Burkholderiales bacterium]|nr:RsmE family RNA methyltransferase [Burkholderiales bacterium]
FGSWIASMPAPAPGEHRLMLAPGAAQRLVELQPPAAAAARLLVGPEGGLTPAEAETAAARGFVAVRLGPRILRTETAGATALAVLQTLWGDF